MIPQSNIDLALANFKARLGQPYWYGGSWSPTDTSADTDCSGLVGDTLEALVSGPAMQWGHPVSTESWPYDYTTNTAAAPGTVGPFGTIAIASVADAPADAIAIVAIHHGGGGVDSHTNISVQGYLMEDNGQDGVCDAATGAESQADSYWTDWWYLAGPVGVTTNGVDYAGGIIAAADLLAAGYTFACRYLAPGGSDLPAKQLQPAEAAQLTGGGVGIVSNWESTGIDAEQGYAAGVADAQAADAQHLACGGPADRPIFFSLDWDEDPTQDAEVDAYFTGVASVIGLARTGVYGGYWICKRLLDAGLVTWAWQTEAWSADPGQIGPDGPDGEYLDPRVNVLQRNDLGYATIDGVQCDIDEAQTADFGQWNYTGGSTFMPDLTATQQTDLYAKVVALWGAEFNKVTSASPFRAAGEGAIWERKDLPVNDDGFLHPQYVAWAAAQGSPAALATLKAVAAINLTTYPDRAADVALAKSVLGSLAAVPSPAPSPSPAPTEADVVVPTPAPSPAPAPLPAPVPVPVPVPVPAPLPVPATPGVVTVNKQSVIEGFHSVVTILSGGLAAGTWALSAFSHDLSPTWATVISSGLVSLGSLVNFLTKEDNKLGGS